MKEKNLLTASKAPQCSGWRADSDSTRTKLREGGPDKGWRMEEEGIQEADNPRLHQDQGHLHQSGDGADHEGGYRENTK